MIAIAANPDGSFSMAQLVRVLEQGPPDASSAAFIATWLPSNHRKVTECQCAECKAACDRTPCLGTPEDIKRLIERGHFEQLVVTDWHAGQKYGLPSVPMVQLKADFEGRAAEQDNWLDRLAAMQGAMGGACPLWDRKTGLCTVHAYKPTEGKIGNCHEADARQSIRESPTLAVVFTWLLPGNRALVRELFTKMGQKPYPFWPKEEADHFPDDPFAIDEGEHRSP